MSKMKYLLILLTLFTSVQATTKSACERFIQHITQPNLDSPFEEITLQNLISVLGKADAMTKLKTEYFYQWKNFMTWFTSSGVRLTMGSYPGEVYVKEFDLNYVLNQLGNPLLVRKDHQVQYRWSCEKSGFISAIAFDNGNLKTIEGKACDKSSCYPFEKNYNVKSELQDYFDQQIIKRSQSTAEESFKHQAELYKKAFKIDIHNPEALKKDMHIRMKSFYASLRNCEPGKYKYALNNFRGLSIETSHIIGMRNGYCLMESAAGKTNRRCKFAVKHLAAYTENAAEKTVAGTLFTNTGELEKIDCEELDLKT